MIYVVSVTMKDSLSRFSIKKANLLKIDAERSKIEIFNNMDDEKQVAVDQFSVEFHESLDTNLYRKTIN